MDLLKKVEFEDLFNNADFSRLEKTVRTMMTEEQFQGKVQKSPGT